MSSIDITCLSVRIVQKDSFPRLPQEVQRLERLTLLLSGDPPHRSQNDDYFPQGDEYEDEIGTDDYGYFPDSKKSQKQRGRKSPKSSATDEDHDDFTPALLASSRRSSAPMIRTRKVDSSTGTVLSKNVSQKDTLESLQALVEKAAEFKRRIFRSAVSDGETESKIQTRDDKKTGSAEQSGDSKEDQMISNV